jgi:hypothetical protein
MQRPLPAVQGEGFQCVGDAGPGIFIDVDKNEAVFAGDQHRRME